MIEPIEDLEKEVQEHEEEVMEEEPQLTNCMMHALAGDANPQTMKVGGLLKHPITVLIDIDSTNNFMNNKVVAGMTLHIKDCSRFDIKVTDNRILKCDRRCSRMEWSRPKQQGATPGPRAGHAGVTVGENWFIAGGGNNMNGISETLVLNMATLVWSVVTTVQGRVPLASEVYVLKPSHISDLQSRMIDGPVSDTTAAVLPTTTSRDMEPEIEGAQDKKIKEIEMDNGDSELVGT
ncbi:hypothetical protein B296_00015877 [Ensete ventricosum]|uniref:Uncharacterized protein n=1 Tax=Ensete ventricosum TaxID=4639 RepID=A0A427AIZ1_ENSVE|nr:hypothetical protein B296_00015877 [Ensete ventricosum]